MRAGVVLLIACAAGVAHAQPAHLRADEVPGGAIEPEPPTIELVTFGVGARIFEIYGHAAICLRYHQPEHPAVCFNYGVTNFDAGAAMVWGFLRRDHKFWVEPTSFESMVSFYRWEDRDIWVQTLPIAGAQARAVEARLWSDIQEANRYYNYDHLLDNCTTRLRDMIDQATGGALRAGSDARHPLTFRELGRRGIARMPVLLALSDLVAGRELDEHPTMWQAMFLPEIFRQEVAARLGAEPHLVYQRRGPAFPVDGSSGRLGVLALALAFTLPLVVAQWRRRWQTAALGWLSVGLTVVGAAVWALVFVSTISAVRYNEAMFVVMPIDIVLPFLGAARLRRYARFRVGLLALCSLLAAVGVFHQPLWILIAAVFLPMATIAFDVPHGLLATASAPAPAVSAEVAAGQ
jgi:hypothetical protein